MLPTATSFLHQEQGVLDELQVNQSKVTSNLPVTIVKQMLLTPYRRNDPIGHKTNS